MTMVLPKPGVVIMGLDPSLTATGVVVMHPDGRVIVVRCIVPGKLTGIARLILIRDTVCMLAWEHKVGFVVVEGFGFGARQSQAHSLGGIGWILRLALVEMDIPCLDVPPSTLKKFITGKGNAPKAGMLKAVYKKWEFDTDNDNIADGYALAKLGIAALHPKQTKANQELLTKVTVHTRGS